MNKIEFLVQGSSPIPYRITIEKSGLNLNAFCTCQAGVNGQFCKHRFSILSGNSEGLVSDNISKLKDVVDWLVGTDVEKALRDLALAEDGLENAKKSLAIAKKQLAKYLHR